MNSFSKRRLSHAYEIGKYSIVTAVIAALSISLAVWLLSLALLMLQGGAARFGYAFDLSDELKKTIIAILGAIGVAAIALYGVRTQNRSAENRHRIDSSLALRKDIFLQAAEAFSTYHSYLVSFSDPNISATDRKGMIESAPKLLVRLHLVANERTIFAAMDAAEQWNRAMIKIELMEKLTPEATAHARLARIEEIHVVAEPFMQRLWRFNIIAREEIGSAFDNEESYFAAMQTAHSRVHQFIAEVQKSIEVKTRAQKIYDHAAAR